MYKKSVTFLFFLLILINVLTQCIRKYPDEPENYIYKNEPVEDTTRIYTKYVIDVDGTILRTDTMAIYSNAVHARFYPWVTDTIKIKELLKKHNLRPVHELNVSNNFIEADLCVTDNRRAEYHFTPYGKEGFRNFGADSLVEYAFAVFGDGWLIPSGKMVFKFTNETTQTRIDSLFEENGLRLLRISPDYPSGSRYWALITPKSKKNVLDLWIDLQDMPFIIYSIVDIGISYSGINCDK